MPLTVGSLAPVTVGSLAHEDIMFWTPFGCTCSILCVDFLEIKMIEVDKFFQAT